MNKYNCIVCGDTEISETHMMTENICESCGETEKGKELLEQQEMAEYMERHGERYGQGY